MIRACKGLGFRICAGCFPAGAAVRIRSRMNTMRTAPYQGSCASFASCASRFTDPEAWFLFASFSDIAN